MTTVEHFKSLFEGREAIYVDKGVWHVKVSNIRFSRFGQCISAEVEEIPTPGLPIPNYQFGRCKIGACYETSFSDHAWHSNFQLAAWSLFFAPSIVNDVLGLAARFPAHLGCWERYDRIVHYIQDKAYEVPCKGVFPVTREEKKPSWRIW